MTVAVPSLLQPRQRGDPFCTDHCDENVTLRHQLAHSGRARKLSAASQSMSI
jgi:hypothetical protein